MVATTPRTLISMARATSPLQQSMEAHAGATVVNQANPVDMVDPAGMDRLMVMADLVSPANGVAPMEEVDPADPVSPANRVDPGTTRDPITPAFQLVADADVEFRSTLLAQASQWFRS
jgi:hypothetical protein